MSGLGFNAEGSALSLVDGLSDLGVPRNRRAERCAQSALEQAYQAGEKAGRFQMVREVNEAIGTVHGLSHLKEESLMAALRVLAKGGRVTITVENEPPKPALKLPGGGA